MQATCTRRRKESRNVSQIYFNGHSLERIPLLMYGLASLTIPMAVDSATLALAIVMATILRFMLVRLNKKLDAGEQVEGAVVATGQGIPGEAAKKGFRFLY
jgi:hypothetical protein